MSRELSRVADVAEQLGDRFSMVAEPLKKSATTLREVAETGTSRLPDDVFTAACDLAGELPKGGASREFVEDLNPFQADRIVGRILDLANELDTHAGRQ